MIPMNLVINKRHFSIYESVLKYRKIFITFILAFSLTIFPLGIPASLTQEEGNLLDGIISEGEYEFNITVGGGDYSLFWKNIGEEVYFAIRGNTTGWVSIGIDPEVRMENADMIFGWVNSTGVFTIDAFSIGQTGPHPPDITLEGTDDISDFNGTEASGVTIIEFKRLLNTYDKYDKPIPTNESVTILWAIGSSDSFESPHVKRGDFEFSLAGITGPEDEIADFFSPLILSSALVLSLAGLLIFVDSFGRQHQHKKEYLGGEDE
ncbi:MAG: hypothetical protein JSV04_03080 [Candidatus Heimdallarchaeota archaeon]|nr:MAG: hypothetical protein JSV04_03080 [Candidatus Heimdallarchaeota archaeon]